jgi:hypothetical protein
MEIPVVSQLIVELDKLKLLLIKHNYCLVLRNEA